MSEKKLCHSRIIENICQPDLINKLWGRVCESVADAFLSQIEYGKDYIISTELVKEDWANGFGTKYTCNLKFDELVRCRDCEYYEDYTGCCTRRPYVAPTAVTADGFCKWGERKAVDE